MTLENRFEWVADMQIPEPTGSRFRCPRCGLVRNSTEIRYDALGYPICPGCGLHAR